MSHLVSKEKIGKNGEYNLSGDRYKEIEIYNGSYPMVELGEVINLDFGVRITKKDNEGKKYPVYGGGGESFRTNTYNREDEYVISRFAMSEYCVRYVRDKFFMLDSGFTFSLKEKYENQADKNYIGLILMNKQDIVYRCARGHAQKNLDTNQFKQIKIPLPPIEIQKKIVEEIDSYQKIIDGAKQVVENYKPRIEIKKNWEMKELGEVCEINPKKMEVKDLDKNTEVSFVPMVDINEHNIEFEPKHIKEIKEVYTGYTYFKENDVLLARVTPCFENGKSGIAKGLKNGIGFGSSEFTVFRSNDKVMPQWIYYIISNWDFLRAGKNHMSGTGGLQRLTKDFINSYKIPLPPLNIQQQIVKEIEKEQDLVNANKELIKIFEKKIESVINKVWEG